MFRPADIRVREGHRTGAENAAMPTVANGQTLNVSSGQTSTGVIVDFGGTLDMFFGGGVRSRQSPANPST
jgi:autotransporter passenger strand-loop-strand repeat protein